ncbi:LCP family protein [Desulfosporosinus fructosivorans]|nr:LCP family protein [Desulfosporosinus fructosivorans]
MQKTKSYGRAIFGILKGYKKAMLLGLFLGISLVFGAVLVNQVIGNEEKPILNIVEHSIQNREESKEQTNASEEKSSEEESIEEEPIEHSNDSVVDPEQLEPYHEVVSNFKGERFTVLLVGLDRRPGDTTLSNTDTLIVASVNTANGKVALLSIPRDTQVIIPGYGKEKINAAARVGKGIKTTTALIEDLIGQSIDGYVITNFNGFKSIIDKLDGITLNVEKNMYYVTGDSSDGVINLKKGTQRLNGAQALQYARFRQDALADITRTARQQAVIKAIGKEFLQVKTIPKLPWLVPQIVKSVETNLSITQLWGMTNYLLRNQEPEIASQTLPGNFLIENDISYWKANAQKSRAIVKRLFEEGKTSSTFFEN